MLFAVVYINCYFWNTADFLFVLIQAKRLAQCPMAIVSKAATVLQVEHFVDMMPVAWELLLETDQELASSAGKVCLF